MRLKKVIPEKELLHSTVMEKFFSIGAFCHKGKLIFLKPTSNSASFDAHEGHIVKNCPF
jgi:hypothetical protein